MGVAPNFWDALVKRSILPEKSGFEGLVGIGIEVSDERTGILEFPIGHPCPVLHDFPGADQNILAKGDADGKIRLFP